MARKLASAVKKNPDVAPIKTLLREEVDARRQELTALALQIHANPEVGFQEKKAVGWLTNYLKRNSFSIETGICGLDTAFRAVYGKGKPVIAVLAEYDALPKLGHACGHNLIAGMAVGAGVAAKKVVDEFAGTVQVIGTPAEELYGGKIFMVERGAFNGVDAAMMVHPDTLNMAATKALACQNLDIEFFGKAAHAAARPEAGINALDAMVQSFTAINALRQHIKSTARLHGIITDGGEAPNIVPAHTAATFIIRAEEDSYLDDLKERVLNCFIGAGVATGARLEYKWGEVRYASLRNNMTMAKLFRDNLQTLGRRVALLDPARNFGSTDMGNVSQVIPGIHPSIAIAPAGVLVHSQEFRQAAASDKGMAGLLDGAKAMAMTVADLLANPENLVKAKEEFAQGSG